jgi:hypothetical protein
MRGISVLVVGLQYNIYMLYDTRVHVPVTKVYVGISRRDIRKYTCSAGTYNEMVLNLVTEPNT